MDFQSKASGPLIGGLCAPSVHVGVDPGKGDITAVWIDESAEIPQEALDRLRGECQPASPERVAALRAAGQRARDVPIAEASAAEPERPGATLWPVPPPASPEALAREDAPLSDLPAIQELAPAMKEAQALVAVMTEAQAEIFREFWDRMVAGTDQPKRRFISSFISTIAAPSILSGGRGVQPDAPATNTMSRALRLAVPSDDPRLGVAAFLPREG